MLSKRTYVGVVERIREQNEVSRPSRLVGHVLGDFLRALVVLLNADDRQGGRKYGGRRWVGNSVEMVSNGVKSERGGQHTHSTVKLAYWEEWQLQARTFWDLATVDGIRAKKWSG